MHSDNNMSTGSKVSPKKSTNNKYKQINTKYNTQEVKTAVETQQSKNLLFRKVEFKSLISI